MRISPPNLWVRGLLWAFRSEMGHSQRASEDKPDGSSLVLHASCVACRGQAVLILGASGRGKSSLALQMMALGAELVADDRTSLTVRDADEGRQLMAVAPATISGLIEARGVGILNAKAVGPCQVVLAVDLDQSEEQRLPPLRHIDLLSIRLPLLHMLDSPAFPAAILQYLKAGRSA